MAATTTNSSLTIDRNDPLKTTLGAHVFLRWQTLVFIAILLAAIFTRLYNLGDRAMSHDESLHVYYSYNLYAKGEFNHTPLMHGPILFHATAFMYALFGDNDFSGRLYAAILGIGMVMSPLLFRRWLGTWGTILACLMILISPLLMYYNRYIREDTPAIMASILMAWSALVYISGAPDQRRQPRYLYILSAAMLWNLGSKETAFFYIGIFGLFLTIFWLFRMAQVRWGIAGRQWFNAAMMAILYGGVIAIAMYTILDITPLGEVTANAQIDGMFGSVVSRSFIIWSLGAVAVTVVGILGTVLWAFRGKFSRIPWREFAMMVLAALIVTAAFIVVEERSHVTREDLGIIAPLDPNVVDPETHTGEPISWFPVIIPWVVMVGALVLFRISRIKNDEGKDWWDWLNQFPELDVLWIMGTLVLPWITAIFIVSASGSPERYALIGQNAGALSGLLPLGSGPTEIGKFIVGLLCFIPLMVTSIAAGMTWNWRRFLVCWLVFHGIFAFFFTTMFTNIQGFATGMVYSLQYWLEQQAERRGSQPQYYYTLIIMPLYEFLPIIGSVLAALGGSFIYWMRRAQTLALESELSANHKRRALIAKGEAVAVTVDDDAEGGTLAETGAVLPAGTVTEIDARDSEIKYKLGLLNTLTDVPFLLFVSFWAIFNIVFFTLAGEKMPWLGTHMTLPMIFIAAWYFGRIFDRIDFAVLRRIGWVQLLVYPMLLAAVFQLVIHEFTGQGPFRGDSQTQLQNTYSWLAVAAVAIASAAGLYYLNRHSGQKHSRQMLAVAVFALLSIVTFRAAAVASFINYDLPTEFLVYAHATHNTKTAMDMLEELSQRTTDGYNIRFAYDNKLSWPGAWYFRHFKNAAFMGDTPTLPQMENAVVVFVGDGNRNVVEPLLEDRYQRFDFKRMWWPMQEYFYMNATRLIDLFALEDNPNQVGDYKSADLRLGLWDVFWWRDYTKYGQAIGRNFALNEWPVSENMYMYIRKDYAVQVWPYGTGDGSVTSPIDQTEVSACITNWIQPAASIVYDLSALGGQLIVPTGMDVSDDGRVFVAEDQGYRISEFTTDGQFIRSFGQKGTAETVGTFFERPHSVKIAPDGRIVVVDTWNYRIRVFDTELQQVASWGRGETSGVNAKQEPTDGFWGPRDAAIGPDGNVYISDTGNKRVRVYTLDGEWVRDIGSGGTGPGQLDEPTGLAIHSDGRLFVADTWNRRISVFALDGTFLTSYPVRAWYDEFGNRPYLALDESRGLLYITDPDGGRVLVYNTDGDCIGAFGRLNREAPGPSEFSTLGGIATDVDGNVYLVDLNKGRLLRFDPFPVAPLNTANDMLNEMPEGSIIVPLLPESTAEEVEPQG